MCRSRSGWLRDQLTADVLGRMAALVSRGEVPRVSGAGKSSLLRAR